MWAKANIPPGGSGTVVHTPSEKASPTMADTPATAAPTHGYTPEKDALLKRLRRIEGQVRGVQGMVESDRYCIDILTQISAVQAALDKVALGLLTNHAEHC